MQKIDTDSKRLFENYRQIKYLIYTNKTCLIKPGFYWLKIRKRDGKTDFSIGFKLSLNFILKVINLKSKIIALSSFYKENILQPCLTK